MPLTADEYLVWLNQACRRYYGVAGRAYLRRLLKDHAEDFKKLLSAIRGDMEKFERDVALHNMSTIASGGGSRRFTPRVNSS